MQRQLWGPVGCSVFGRRSVHQSSRLARNAVGRVSARTLPNGATAGVDDDAWALADRLNAAAYTSDTTDAMTRSSARAGVATFADPSSQSPESRDRAASPFELLGFQTHALAVGAWAVRRGPALSSTGSAAPGCGYGLAPTSAVLAGYVAAVDTPARLLSRALMAGQDLLNPSTLEFPGVVLVLFASDIATNGRPDPGSKLDANRRPR